MPRDVFPEDQLSGTDVNVLSFPLGSLAGLSTLPPGTNLIGHVVINSGTLDVASLPALPAGSNALGSVQVSQLPFVTHSDTFTGTGNGTLVNLTASPLKSFSVQVKSTGAIASIWDVRLEGSLNGSDFSQILQHTNVTGDAVALFTGTSMAPALYIRARVAGLTLGTATNIVVTYLGLV